MGVLRKHLKILLFLAPRAYGLRFLQGMSDRRAQAEHFSDTDVGGWEKIGAGKDVIAYRTAQGGVFKQYTWHGRRFEARARLAAERLSDLTFFVAFNFSSAGYFCDELEVSGAPLSIRAFLRGFAQMAHAQSLMVNRGWLYWDFGFVRLNYHVDVHGEFRLMDYGGNAFLPLDGASAAPRNCYKPPLNAIDPDFIRLCVLAHVMCFALGEIETVELVSLAQFGSAPTRKALKICVQRLADTTFHPISEIVMADGFEVGLPQSWRRLEKALHDLAEANIDAYVQETADIASISIDGAQVRVRGYQDFDLGKADITFRRSSKKHWETARKAEVVKEALNIIAGHGGELRSALDIGCNLGAYVFLMRLDFHIPEVQGVDYNSEYIDQCYRIAELAQIEHVSFATGTFGSVVERFDLVLMLGLVHHLFHRTEEFNDLSLIVNRIAQITKQYAIVEFPDEHDPKARKWASGAGGGYCEKAFLAAAESRFESVQLVGQTAPHRRVYLMASPR